MGGPTISAGRQPRFHRSFNFEPGSDVPHRVQTYSRNPAIDRSSRTDRGSRRPIAGSLSAGIAASVEAPTGPSKDRAIPEAHRQEPPQPNPGAALAGRRGP